MKSKKTRSQSKQQSGTLWESRSTHEGTGNYSELFCVNNFTLARKLAQYRNAFHQAVLFPGPNSKRADLTDDWVKDLLKAIGIREPENANHFRYSRLFLCRTKDRRGVNWIEQTLRQRAPQLFSQYRVFEIQLPNYRRLRPDAFFSAVGNASPITVDSEV